MGVKLLLLALEEKGKRSILKAPHKQLPKETTSGVFSRSLFWWLNPLFLGAFRRFIKWDDLPEIDSKLSSSYLTEDFERRWVGRCEFPFHYILQGLYHRSELTNLDQRSQKHDGLLALLWETPFLAL